MAKRTAPIRGKGGGQTDFDKLQRDLAREWGGGQGSGSRAVRSETPSPARATPAKPAQVEKGPWVAPEDRNWVGRYLSSPYLPYPDDVERLLGAVPGTVRVSRNPTRERLEYIRDELYDKGRETDRSWGYISRLREKMSPDDLARGRSRLEVRLNGIEFEPQELGVNVTSRTAQGLVWLSIQGEELAAERQRVRDLSGMESGSEKMNRLLLMTVKGDLNVIGSLAVKEGLESTLSRRLPETISATDLRMIDPYGLSPLL